MLRVQNSDHGQRRKIPVSTLFDEVLSNSRILIVTSAISAIRSATALSAVSMNIFNQYHFNIRIYYRPTNYNYENKCPTFYHCSSFRLRRRCLNLLYCCPSCPLYFFLQLLQQPHHYFESSSQIPDISLSCIPSWPHLVAHCGSSSCSD